MAYENLCMYCFEDNGGADVCPHCGRDAREAVPQIQLLPGTLVYRERFLVGRALGQDAGGIVYQALDTKRGTKIRIREYFPRDCARRLNSGEVVPEAGSEDPYENGLKKLRASVEGVEDPSKRHFFFEENGTGYIAQRKYASSDESTREQSDHRGARMAMVVGIAAVLVLAVAAGVIWFVSKIASKTDTITAPSADSEDIWTPPESPTPTPYVAATFGAIAEPTHSWMEFTNPDLAGNGSDYVTPTPVPTPENGFGSESMTISSASSATVIRKLQRLLINLGWMDESGETGEYDSATRQAVRQFQRYVNDNFDIPSPLSVDGIAGPKTLEWLLQTQLSIKPTPTPAPVTPSPTQKNQVVDENAGTAAVKYVQTQLQRLGVLSENQITGKYDTNTRRAVQAFQKRVNSLMGYEWLKEDGICDDSTLAYLDYYVQWWESSRPTPSPEPTHALSTPASTGETIDEHSDAASIRRIQEMLISLGYLNGRADGAYGSRTYTAVSRFQQAVVSEYGNVVPTDGRCDPETQRYLEMAASRTGSDVPAAEAPAISVTGAQEYTGGVYVVGTSGVKISWTAKGADSYSVYLTDKSGNILSKEEGIQYTALTLTASSLSVQEEYVFRVLAIPRGGSAAQGASSYVKLVASPEAQATPVADAVGMPEIRVSGADRYSGGVYHLTGSEVTVNWSAENATRYSVYLTDGSDGIVSALKSTAKTEYRLETVSLNPGEKYTVTVVALPPSGVEADGSYASVRLILDESAATPAVTPASDVKKPVIEVGGALAEEDGVYTVGDTPISIRWSAKGSVRAYSVYLTNSEGTPLLQRQETTDTVLNIPPVSMNGGERYTVTVCAIPEGGTEQDGVSASVALEREGEPTPEPVAPIGELTLNVSGQFSEENGVYYAKTDALTISWSAEGEVSGYNLSISMEDGTEVWSRTAVTDRSRTLDPRDLEKGATYLFTVTAVPAGGTAQDGASASVYLARYEAPPLEAPVILVQGEATEEGNVYSVGTDGAEIAWSSGGATLYDAVLTTEAGDKVTSVRKTDQTQTTLSADMLKRGIVYRLTITAYGDEDRSSSASVLLEKAAPGEVTVPEFEVTGYEEWTDDVYYVGGENLEVTWHSENAASYDVVVSGGKKDSRAEGVTQTQLQIKRSQMEEGILYELKVTALPEGGEEADGKSASLRFALSKPEPTPEPEMEPAVINLKGQLGVRDEVYYVGQDELTVSWAAPNAVTYNVALRDETGNVVKSIDQTSQTSAKFDGKLLQSGHTYTLSVTPVDAKGREGKETSVLMEQYEVDATAEPIGLGETVIAVSGEEAYDGGIYRVGKMPIQIEWSAENAAAYLVRIDSDDGEAVYPETRMTRTGVELKPAQMEEGRVYTLKVTPLTADRVEGESAQVLLARMEPDAETGMPILSVIGAEEGEDGIYIVTADEVLLTWEAENAAQYRVLLTDDRGEVLYPESATEKTRVTLRSAQMEAGRVYTLTVAALAKDGSGSQPVSVKLQKEEAPEAGAPRIEVTGFARAEGDTYYLGENPIDIFWEADGAESYMASIEDDLGDELYPESRTSRTGVTVSPDQVEEGRVYTLRVAALERGGRRSEDAEIRFAKDFVWDSMTITPMSDPEQIQQVQMRLYELGWLPQDGSAKLGVLDEVTVQAVYDYQQCVIQNGLNEEMTLIDPANPVIDEITLTMLADPLSPLNRQDYE